METKIDLARFWNAFTDNGKPPPASERAPLHQKTAWRVQSTKTRVQSTNYS